LSPGNSNVALLCVLAVAPALACSSPPTGDTAGVEDSESGSGDMSSGTGSTTDPDGPPTDQPITWHQHVAPLVVGTCSGCHQGGGIAPFSLAGYEEAFPWAQASLDALERGSMPPFLAAETSECAPRHGFQDDPRLSEDELELVRKWVAAGAPEGDPATAAPLPTPPSLELTDADIRAPIAGKVTIDGAGDKFYCFSVDPGITTDTWVDAIQINPGNPKIVHHVLAYLDETGESAEKAGPEGYYPCFGGAGISQPRLIAAWAPGALPIETPPNVASLVKAGSRIVLNVHYHPTGSPEIDDSTSIDLRTRDAVPEYVALLALIGNADGGPLLPGPNDDGGPEFRIPAGAVDHTEEMLFSLNGVPDLRIFSAGTHMHYVGTDMIVGLQRANPGDDPAEECLVQTPNWDFSWQRSYAYDAPLADVPVVRAGDKVYLRCTYNNSMSNPFVARALAEQGLDAPVDVYLGEETLDEMCLGVMGVAVALKDAINL
jgi:hypothetical protein